MALDLITGFPGFIGRLLAARLLEEDDLTIVALVEERMLEPAREAAAEIGGGRIEVVAGDIADRRLGLDDGERERIVSEVRRVYHLAAIYDLAVPIELAQRVNVDGTGNVLELCAEAQSLERLVYISTAYVAGLRRGVVYEHELVMGQGFKNHYESTKFQAEVWARRYLDRVPTTILRPAIVVGDSRTGRTQKFDGPYYLLKAVSRATRADQPLMHFGRSDSPFNVVPVDFVVEAIAAAAAAAGDAWARRCTWSTPSRSPGASCSPCSPSTTAVRRRRGASRPGWPRWRCASHRCRRRFGGTPRESIAYLNHPVVFDMRRCVDLLGARGLTPPKFTDYAEPMVSFFKEHEDDPAFAPKS